MRLGRLEHQDGAEPLRLHCRCGRSYLTTLELTQCTHAADVDNIHVKPRPDGTTRAQQGPRLRAQAIAAGLIVPRGGDPEDAA